MYRFVLLLLLLFTSAALPQEKRLNIAVDERIELITTLQMISESSVMTLTGANIGYASEVAQRFGEFKHHPAVTLFDSIHYRYFNFEMPFEYILHYSLPDFKVAAPIQAGEFSESKWSQGHADTLRIFARELKDFYITSHFNEFYSSHRVFYDSLCRDVASTLVGKKILPALERYYGSSFTRYNLILSPLSLDGGFGITVRNGTESYVYAIIGPAYTSKGYPKFKKSNTIVIHEMSHPFSNPVIDSCWSALRSDTCLYTPVRMAMRGEGYWDWKSVVYETLNRANEVMLTTEILGQTEGETLYSLYIAKKFDYLPACMAVLRQYKANRSIYRRIQDIRPMLLKAFEEETDRVCRR